MLEYITRYNKPNIKPQKIIIWLHGMGANFDDSASFINYLTLNESVKFVLPNAPVIKVTALQGYKMRCWYDVLSYNDFVNRANFEDVNSNCELIHQLVTKEIENGFSKHDIIIGGFSQGGLMSYYSGLNYKTSIIGVVALSCYTIKNKQLYLTVDNSNTQIFAAHGKIDDVIPYNIGYESYQLLKNNGFNIKWHEYEVAHNISMQGIKDISMWLNSLFNTHP